jgi:electron-transferring-flavoprotein dehydrogenase
VRDTFAGGKRIAYGARAITQGGFQSVPKLVFPGGALIGCAAGFLNVPRIKGTHNAMTSGMLAAEAIGDALRADRKHDELSGYEEAWRNSPIGKDLWKVRNVKPLLSRFGTVIGVALGGFDIWLLAVRDAQARQAGLRHAQAGITMHAYCLSEAGREAHF